MKNLSKKELKQIVGGVVAPESVCSVTCPNGLNYTRNCGPTSTCSSNGSVISCGSETSGRDMCAGTPSC